MTSMETQFSLAALALEYGTINREQYSHLTRLHTLKQREGHPAGFDILLLNQKLATRYQIGLLKLIQEFLIFQKKGIEFGQIAIEKGFAIQEDIDRALEQQKQEFKRAKIRKLVGDILVASGTITESQKDQVLQEQDFLEGAEQNITPDSTDKIDGDPEKTPVELSDYEKQFLEIKVLDQEFAASVLEKGFAEESEVRSARKIQESAFETEKKIQMLGDIMVSLSFITPEQKLLIYEELGRKVDDTQKSAILELEVSTDKMSAYAVISEDHIGRVTVDDIMSAVCDSGIKAGIFPEAVLQCYLTHKVMKIPVARQTAAPGFISSRKTQFFFNTETKDDAPKKRGETLAAIKKTAVAPVQSDLYGNVADSTMTTQTFFRCGSGTRMAKDQHTIFAAKHGFPSLSIENKLYVHPETHIHEDADMKYGPLEPFGNITIAGVLTGAYPVTAGDLAVEEIRGATIDAVGSIEAQVGITNADMRVQGDIHARYIHTSTIVCCGNIYVDNEIIDSSIYCGGKISSEKCHIITSTLYGKNGIVLKKVGNERTRPCILGAGSEHHIFQLGQWIEEQIEFIRRDIDMLILKKELKDSEAAKTFQKMVELKIFHDRAKARKSALTAEFKLQRKQTDQTHLKKTAVLINNYGKRVKSSIQHLKKLNQKKKQLSSESEKINGQIKKLNPKIHQQVVDLQNDFFSYIEWTKYQESDSRIKIGGGAVAGTILKGVFSRLQIDEDQKGFVTSEKKDADNRYKLVLTPDQR